MASRDKGMVPYGFLLVVLLILTEKSFKSFLENPLEGVFKKYFFLNINKNHSRSFSVVRGTDGQTDNLAVHVSCQYYGVYNLLYYGILLITLLR